MQWFAPYQRELLQNFEVEKAYWELDDLYDIYWARSLMQKMESGLVFEALPEHWDKSFFKWCLFAFGYVAGFRTERFGINFNPATISGYNFQYQPTKTLVTNPLFQKEFTLGKDAELIRLTPDYLGILDVVVFYAKKLSELSKGIAVGAKNTKIPVVFTAMNPSQNATLRMMYEQMQKMESLIIYEPDDNSDEILPNQEPFSVWQQNFKETYIVTELLENINSVLDDFYAEIGLPVSLDKKSHVLNSEANFQQLQSQARLSCWLECLTDSLSKFNKMFGTNISVHEKLVEEGGNSDDYGQTGNSGDME